MKILYFSATGNSLSVAKQLGGELLSIPQLVKQQLYTIEDEVVGIICPTYCADAPRMVQEYLAKAQIKADYTFAVCTYGYMAGAATEHVRGYLEKAAGHADYVSKLIMVDTALTRFETQKQLDMLPSKNVEGQLRTLCEDIANRKKYAAPVSTFDKLVDWLYHTAGASQIAPDRAKAYLVSDACVKCGTCAKVCPADNIVVTDHVAFLDHCEGCLGCLHNCPKTAIHLKNEKSAVRFRNAEISIGELMKANS